MLPPLCWEDNSHLSQKVQFKCHHLNLQMRWSLPVAAPALGSDYKYGTSMCWVSISPMDDAVFQHGKNPLEHKKLPRPIFQQCAPNWSLKQTKVLHKHSYYHFLLMWLSARFTQDTKNSRALFFSLFYCFCFIILLIIFSSYWVIFKCSLLLVSF